MTLNNNSILITGGTGSLGKCLVKTILERWPDVNKIVVFSRDEQKQFQMANEFPFNQSNKIRYFIGDVRDLERLKRAFTGIDYVIHAAAMKHVHIAEYNPDECVKTNIGGAENVIMSSLSNNVKGVVALSTDKACAPVNLYGATKLTSDKLFIAANNIKGTQDIKFTVVRYGNVMGSNGSVIPFFMNKKDSGEIPITDPEMTRFNITIEDGVEMVLHSLFNSWGGELYVPKIPSYKILDMAKAIAPNCKVNIIGVRPGEKIHEEMITKSDSLNTYDLGNYYVILPHNTNWDLDLYLKTKKAKLVPKDFNYNSGENEQWETVDSLRSLIKSKLYPDFKF
jgi:UDP-N-acetylglucosamine 4,6-dehydratase (inverting)